MNWLFEVKGNPERQAMVKALALNLFQNSPGGMFRLFLNAKKAAGYDAKAYFEDAWKRVCFSKYADWGFRSKQYLASGGKNPPRVLRIQKAFKEFYGVDLMLYKP